MVKVCGFENDVKVLVGNMTNYLYSSESISVSLLNLVHVHFIPETVDMVEMRGKKWTIERKTCVSVRMLKLLYVNSWMWVVSGYRCALASSGVRPGD